MKRDSERKEERNRMGEREGLNRGSVQNRCNQPRTLCFNSLDAAPMSAYVAARSYISLPRAETRTHTCATCGPLAERCICAYIRVHHVDRHVAGYYRSPRYHRHSSPNSIAYSRLSATIRASLFAVRKLVFLPIIFQ